MVGKRQRVLNAELDQKILGLYSLGMSYRDISRHLREIYGVETNEATINAVTELVVEDLRAWQSRPLDRLYVLVDGRSLLQDQARGICPQPCCVHCAGRGHARAQGRTGHVHRRDRGRALLAGRAQRSTATRRAGYPDQLHG
ncbi:MAG: transposase [Flavobacteriales bacterium]|nr:transposase [Flavobacteriales bacterium]